MDYINLIKNILSTENAPKYATVKTHGCQMNVHDSEKLEGMLFDMGYQLIDESGLKTADLVIINTCCVRENPENKLYGNLGFIKHIKSSRPEMKVVLCGCMMQQEHVVEKLKGRSYDFVDIVMGTFSQVRFPELFYRNLTEGKRIFDLGENVIESEYQTLKRHNKFKANVNIMYGCDNFCAYCVVPYVRGRERSREADDIIAEIEKLAADGAAEVMLLGQNVNSYGKGLKKPCSFAELLRAVNDIKDLKRIRFMTSHPKDLSDELIDAIAECGKVCKHLHLPLQSGSSKILSDMNRQYTKDEYLTLIEKVRRRILDISITTDIIIGFPGEAEQDFMETIDVFNKVEFDFAYIFKYSIRKGTTAEQLPQLDKNVVDERFTRFMRHTESKISAKSEHRLGKVYRILVEDEENGILSGRTDDNSLVHLKGSVDLIGNLIDVKITKCHTFYYTGEVL